MWAFSHKFSITPSGETDRIKKVRGVKKWHGHPLSPRQVWIVSRAPAVDEQEAQLSQRDRATLHVTEYFAKSLKVTQDHSKRHCWVVPISISLKLYDCISYRFLDIQRQKWRDLETGGKGRPRLARSLKMALFDRPCTTFYWSAIVSILYHFRVIWRWIIVTLISHGHTVVWPVL